MQTED